MEPEPKLAKIWPRVQAEITSARRREKLKRQTFRFAGGLGAAAIIGGLGFLGIRSFSDRPAQASWRVGDVSPAVDMAADYPLNEGKRIYAVHGTGGQQQVVCLDRETGSRIWSSSLRFSKCRLTVHENRVFALALTSDLVWTFTALKAATGEVMWSHPTMEHPARMPSTLVRTRDGLCWCQGNQVVMHDAATGTLLWRTSIGSGRFLATPVERGNVVYTAAGDQLHALRGETGEMLWSLPLPGGTGVPGLNRPILETGMDRLFCATRNPHGGGNLWCIDLEDQRVLWTQTTEAPVRLRFHQDRIFVRSQDLSAYDAATGRALWRFDAGGCGTLHFKGQQVYLVDAAERSRILALDGRTGKVMWTRTAPGSCNGVVISGHFALLSGNNRTLYAFVFNERS